MPSQTTRRTNSDRYADALNKIAVIIDRSESDPEQMRLMLVDIALLANTAIS